MNVEAVITSLETHYATDPALQSALWHAQRRRPHRIHFGIRGASEEARGRSGGENCERWREEKSTSWSFGRKPLFFHQTRSWTPKPSWFCCEPRPRSFKEPPEADSGQVSRVRKELTGSALAPKRQATFDELQRKRPREQVRQVPAEVMEHVPEQAFTMDRTGKIPRLGRVHQRCVRRVP